jgi:ABC-type bacteriocin/lantibiotic exporter with double-glycine peptidase domain
MSSPTQPADPPPRATLGALRRLAPYLRPHRRALIGGGLAALAATLAGLAIPLVVGAVVDGPIARGELAALPWLALGVLGFGLLEGARTCSPTCSGSRWPSTTAGRPGSCSRGPPPT